VTRSRCGLPRCCWTDAGHWAPPSPLNPGPVSWLMASRPLRGCVSPWQLASTAHSRRRRVFLFFFNLSALDVRRRWCMAASECRQHHCIVGAARRSGWHWWKYYSLICCREKYYLFAKMVWLVRQLLYQRCGKAGNADLLFFFISLMWAAAFSFASAFTEEAERCMQEYVAFPFLSLYITH